MAGYHLKDIQRGEYGELSKIYEEVAELQDAAGQSAAVMILIELSDIIGAMEGYLEKHYKGSIDIGDLINMAHITRRAFESGARCGSSKSE